MLAHDVATRIDSRRNGEYWGGSCSGEIYCCELTKPVSQKAVDCTARGRVREAPYNFAGGINTESSGVVRTGEIDCDKGYICSLTPRGITSILGKHDGYHAKQTAHQANHCNRNRLAFSHGFLPFRPTFARLPAVLAKRGFRK
jgi:hypothetical protein